MVKSSLKIALSLVLVFSISAEAQCPNAGSSEDGSAAQASEGDVQAFMAQRRAQMMQQSGQQVDFSSMAAAASGQQRRKKRFRRGQGSNQNGGGSQQQPQDPIMVQPQPVDPPVVVQPAPAPVETPSAGSGSSSAITFSVLTQKVLSVNCNECHSNFSKYSTVKSKANSILSFSEGGHGNLTNEQLDILRAWISGGMVE